MTNPDARPRPDGTAWREAQKNVAANNDEARKRGREERAKADRTAALNRAAAARKGIHW